MTCIVDLKTLLKTDIGLINSGILNGGIKSGAVTRKKLLEICPSHLNPTYLKSGTGYESLANNKNASYNVEYLRDTLSDYLCKEEYLKKAFQDRWIIMNS